MLQGNTQYPDQDDDLGDSMGYISYGGLMVPHYICVSLRVCVRACVRACVCVCRPGFGL